MKRTFIQLVRLLVYSTIAYFLYVESGFEITAITLLVFILVELQDK